MRNTISAVVIGRCAPAAATRDLAKPRSTDWPVETAATRCSTMLSRGSGCSRRPAAARFQQRTRGGRWRLAQPADRLGIPGLRQQFGGRFAEHWPGQPVERGFARSRVAAAGAQRPMTTAEMVCRIEGAFFASFLCTSKERESAAGPKPPPTSAGAARKAEPPQSRVNGSNGPKADEHPPTPPQRPPSCCQRKLYSSAIICAFWPLSAAPPWPPSMFSQYSSGWPCSRIFAAILRA